MKAAAIYARVSTADQADTGTSLESQAIACQKYAEANDYTVIATFKESKSGANLNRPMLDQVREMARNQEIEAVIFYALDRLSRDETDTLILAREWRGKEVDLKCATVPLEDTPQGQFLLTLLAAVGKLERAGILERTMRGKRQSVKNGKVLRPSISLYGYTHQGGKYEIDESQAVWVRQTFSWYVSAGLSLAAIAQRLVDAGVPTKLGGHWTASRVHNILSNEAYTGQYWWGKEVHAAGKKRELRPREEWVGPVAVPPIVGRAVYEAALERIEYNKVNCRRRCQTEYLLRGMIVCELCGRRFAGNKRDHSGRLFRYYVCSNYSTPPPGRPRCKGPLYKAQEIEGKVWQWVMDHLSDPDLIMSLVQGRDQEDQAERDRDQADLRALLGIRSDLGRKEAALIELYTDGDISRERFRERKASIDQLAESNETRIHEIEGRIAAREQVRADILSVRELCQAIQRGLPLREAELTFDEKRQIMRALHISVTAKADGRIRISGMISDDLIALAVPETDTQSITLQQRRVLRQHPLDRREVAVGG